ncbi:MAG: cobalamin biosynthesis protein CobQ [Litoreibacter sp.]
MNTPAHLIFGAAAFARPGSPRVTLAALLGAFLPDLSLYAMAGWHLMILDTPSRVVFGQLYYSERWQAIFAVDNSFILWGALLLFAWGMRKPWLIAFAGAGFLHLLFDFPLHNHDARQHFWPMSDWVFHSPFSYWDRSHHGEIVSYLEQIISVGLLILLWRRFQDVLPRLLIGGAAIMQLSPALLWMFIF